MHETAKARALANILSDADQLKRDLIKLLHEDELTCDQEHKALGVVISILEFDSVSQM